MNHPVIFIEEVFHREGRKKETEKRTKVQKNKRAKSTKEQKYEGKKERKYEGMKEQKNKSTIVQTQCLKKIGTKVRKSEKVKE